MSDFIHTVSDMERLIGKMGFMPFFANEVPGFSIAERTPEHLWFSDEQDGPWEWKDPVILDGGFAYGKFFKGKAMFVTLEWFRHFLNLRRSLAHPSPDEMRLLDTVKEHRSLLTTELRKLCGYSRTGGRRCGNPLLRKSDELTCGILNKHHPQHREGMETCLTRLQMSTLLVTAGFEYKHDRNGRRYGWGVARHCTPEDFFGSALKPAKCSAQESYMLLHGHLRTILPQAAEAQIRHILLP